jgi:hypothetical protein
MRCQSLLISGLLMSLISLSLPARAQTSNSLRTFNLAHEAVDNCYREKQLTECRKLDEIRSTLVDWCVQGDRESCVLLEEIRALIAMAIY